MPSRLSRAPTLDGPKICYERTFEFQRCLTMSALDDQQVRKADPRVARKIDVMKARTDGLVSSVPIEITDR